MLLPRVAILLRYCIGNARRQHMPPERACALRRGFQRIRCRCDAGYILWQRRMDFKVGRPSCGKTHRIFPPGKRHDAIFVIVAKEGKAVVCPICLNPLIAVRQWNEIAFLRSRPPQPQSGNCTLHSMYDGERTPIVTLQRGRVDCKV